MKQFKGITFQYETVHFYILHFICNQAIIELIAHQQHGQ